MMLTRKILVLSAGILLFFGLSVSARAKVVFVEDFASGDKIDETVWSIDYDNTMYETEKTWDYEISDSSLIVTDILHSGNNTEWARLYLVHDLSAPLNDFRVDFDISWDSANNQDAMQGIYIGLYDTNGIRIAHAGYGDSWAGSKGGKNAYIGGSSVYNANELPYSGNAAIIISRKGSDVVIYWDGSKILSETQANPISTIKIWFGSLSGAMTSHIFGTESVGLVRVQDTPFEDGTDFENYIYFPHIAGIDTWETEICTINTSSQQNLSGLLQAYSDFGQLVDSTSVSLAPKARREIVVGEEFSNPSDIGYIVFSSDSQNAIGYLKFYIDGRYRVAIPAASDVNTGDIYISHIASDDTWTTGISMLNTTSLSKDLSIEFDDGTTKTRTIAANEHQAFLVRELFNGEMQPKIKSAVIKNGTGIVGLEIFGTTAGSGANYLSGILLKDDTTTNIYYPHIASNSTWDTGIVAYNPSDISCNLTVAPYRSDGTPLSPQTLVLGGKEKYIGIIQDLNLPNGTAWFSILASNNITGFELFSTKDGKQLGGYTGVGISSSDGVFAKIDKDGGTGIAFVNIEDAPVNVTVTAYDDNGKAIASETFDLKAYEKVVELAADLFSQDISTANYITYASSGEVVGFQLNVSSDGMMLDALPAMGGEVGDGGTAGEGLSYQGITTQVVITEDNAENLTLGAYSNANLGQELTEAPAMMTSLTKTHSANGQPILLKVSQVLKNTVEQVGFTNPPAGPHIAAVNATNNTVTGSCGGSASYSFSVDGQTGEFSGIFSFNNYCEDGTVINGAMTFSAKMDLNSRELISIDFSFESVVITSGSDSSTMSGNLTMNISVNSAVTTVDALVKDTNGEVYWVKDNQIIVTEESGYIEVQMSGDFYDPDYGYVVLSTEVSIKIYDGENYPSSGVLVITGDAGSGQCNTGARLEFFPSMAYQVTADTDGDCLYDDYDSGILSWLDGQS